METKQTLESMKALVRKAGWTPSAGCWESEDRIFAFSLETSGLSTFCTPKFELEYRKDTGELLNCNRPYKAA